MYYFQLEQLLLLREAVIDIGDISAVKPEEIKNFKNQVTDAQVQMCKGVSNNNDIKTNLVYTVIHKLTIDTVSEIQDIQFKKSDATDKSEVDLPESLTEYSEYQCGSSTCNDVCVVLTVNRDDFQTTTSEKIDVQKPYFASAVYEWQVRNTKDGKALDEFKNAAALEDPVTMTLKVDEPRKAKSTELAQKELAGGDDTEKALDGESKLDLKMKVGIVYGTY